MAAAATRTALGRLGFNNAAALRITDQQDLIDLDEFQLLTDAEVGNLCKVLRKPGGQIPNPDAGNAGAPAMIYDPGVSVSLRAENNLKLACYWLRHNVRVSRDATPAMITLVSIRSVQGLRDSETAHENPDVVPKIDMKDWPKTIEAIEEYFRNYLGETGIPLAYVVRKEENVPANPDPSANYDTAMDEMIARAPHADAAGVMTAHFSVDRTKVWQLMSTICRDEVCWT